MGNVCPKLYEIDKCHYLWKKIAINNVCSQIFVYAYECMENMIWLFQFFNL